MEEEVAQTTSWTDSLQDEGLRLHPSLTKFDDVPALAKSYVELESKIGSKGVLLPGENATPAEVRSAMSQLGCPDDPTHLGGPQVPEGQGYDNDFMATMQQAAWQNGLTPTQYQNLANRLVQYQGEAQQQDTQQQQQQVHDAREELERRWGAATAQKLDFAKQAAEAIYGDKIQEAMNTQGPNGSIGNNPAMLEVLAKLGQAMQEGGVLEGVRPQPALTPKDAQDQINQAMLDKDFMAALHDERHMGHKEAYARWTTLYTAANSGSQGPTTEPGGVLVGS